MLKLTTMTPEQRQRHCRSDVIIFNFEHISQLFHLFLLLTLNIYLLGTRSPLYNILLQTHSFLENDSEALTHLFEK